MKAKLHFILALGLLLLKPLYASSSERGHAPSFSHSLHKIREEHLPAIDDLQNPTAFFTAGINDDATISADVDADEDDDASFSARKKISFERTLYFYALLCNFQQSWDKPLSNHSSTSFYLLSPSHFISLGVLRI
ncbi:MAG: hypothetical protein JWO44_229 [Bacteroidetes bacterium]|nr:hypothetical protein [Bacteroidota bacterium]